MLNAPEKQIIEVIAYFSFFGYPLTAFEIWKWLRTLDISFEEVLQILESNTISCIAHEGLYWGLGDLKTQILDRHDRYVNAMQKERRARRVLFYLSKIPWVRGVALCNNLPLHFTRPESDIDFFVLVHRNRVWSARLMAVLPLMLLRLRPHETKRNPVDVSFFADSDAEDFSMLRLEGGDPYLSTWMQSLVPVYEREPGVFDAFFKKNRWAGVELPHAGYGWRCARMKKTRSWFLPSLCPERLAAWVQTRWLPRDITSIANQSSNVLINDHMLKFHLNDRRQDVRDHIARLCQQNGY
ncbi:MAG: hypothetical protein WCT24_02275 [Patescibacteria group bacterium]|jgi:hypothetical protein